jgi:uncharacterized protein YutE (UPF0331/DUF86 family)
LKLRPEERERLIRYVDFLDDELADFQKFSTVSWKTYQENRDLRRNLERWIENIVNCSVDIAKVILVVENRGIPTTYREALIELGSTPYFNEEFGDRIAQWVSLRNILAHDYLDIRWNSVRRFIKSAEPMFRELAEGVKLLLIASAPAK